MRTRATWLLLLSFCALLVFANCESSSDETGDSDPDTCALVGSRCNSTVTGSTADKTENVLNNYKGVSWDMSGPEIIYEVKQNSEEAMVLGIRQKSADFEADYFILRRCDESGSLVAYGDLEARACLDPGTYYIVVDGRGGEKGSFEAEIFCAPCDGDGPDGDEPDGDDPDGDDEDGDEPDGDDPDGDVGDGDEPDGDDSDGDDDCVPCVTAVQCYDLGDDYVCTNGCCVQVNEDGDEPDGDDPDGDDPSFCGCTCDEEYTCEPDSPGTYFTAEGCDWGDEEECSGFMSAYCGALCADDDDVGGCMEDCHAAAESGTPVWAEDGSTFSAWGCSITIHCQ